MSGKRLTLTLVTLAHRTAHRAAKTCSFKAAKGVKPPDNTAFSLLFKDVDGTGGGGWATLTGDEGELALERIEMIMIQYDSEEDPFINAIDKEHRHLSPGGIKEPPPRKPHPLQDCLKSFTSPETLDSSLGWKCEKCNEVRAATKRFTLCRLPPVLVLHLKRFKHTSFMDCVKMSDPITIPKTLDAKTLKSFCTEDVEGAGYSYSLYGVVQHLGSYGAGHYIATVKHSDSGHWYNYDDGICSKMTEAEVFSEAEKRGYVLFYMRNDMFKGKNGSKALWDELRRDQQRGGKAKLESPRLPSRTRTSDGQWAHCNGRIESDQAPSWRLDDS